MVDEPLSRFSLRLRGAAIGAAGAAFGVALPRQACRAQRSGGKAALWLGPDEWLLLAPEAEAPALARCLAAALGEEPHSLVDISHRQLGLTVSGSDAEAKLSGGCPLDLDARAFPVDMCTRTVFGKAEIVLWRTGSDAFHLEVWRSFHRYVSGYLAQDIA